MGKRRWPWVLVGLLVVVLIAKHFLLDTAVAADGEYTIDVAALHRAATSGGALPDHIEVEQVGGFDCVRSLAVAGQGFGNNPMALLVHRVVWPDRSVVIDTGMSPSGMKALPGSKADPAAYDRVVKAISQASAIVFTHEHPDHVGGFAAAPAPETLIGRVQMTSEQLKSDRLERDQFPAGVLKKVKPLTYTGLYPLAPGVVLQKAPGHSPGSQLVYVELANGTRYLFVGDIAWTKDNIRLQKGRAGIAALIIKEDRGAVAAQVKALAALPADIHVIVAHDRAELADDLERGLVHKGFTGI
jgi:glyoxylase-like metal-dependent hydrolase (beta-lactamase superfamily II)